jgi:hypothetical protein
MISFLIFGNYGFHLYYKNKRRLLYKRIGNQNFVEIKNVRTEICAKSKLSFSWQLFMSDIILFENTLLILLRNYTLKNLINQNLSIIQISKNRNAEKLDGVGRIYILENKKFIGGKIKINSTQILMIKAEFEVDLDFNDKLDELKVVTEFINDKLK